MGSRLSQEPGEEHRKEGQTMAFAWRNNNKDKRGAFDESYSTDVDEIYYGKKKPEQGTDGGAYDTGYGYEGVSEVGIEDNDLNVEEVAVTEPLMKRTFTPTSCKDCRMIVDAYKEGRVIVICREALDYENFIRLFDYVMGAVQALNGEMRKLDRDTVALLPYDCDKDIVIAEVPEEAVAAQEDAE